MKVVRVLLQALTEVQNYLRSYWTPYFAEGRVAFFEHTFLGLFI